MKYSRRKFIAATASGVVATAVSPVAFAGKQSESTHKITEAGLSTRVSPSEFIIFPWGSMPSSPSKGQWGDLANINDMMEDLFDCGFNTSGFTSARNIRHIRNNHLAGILTAGINANQEVTRRSRQNYPNAHGINHRSRR